jgi:hypothetical protein
MAADTTNPPHVWCLEHWRGSWVQVTRPARKGELRVEIIAP